MWNLNAWETLLWIIAVELITIPLIAGLVNAIFNGYFRAKEQFITRIVLSSGEVIKQIGEEAKKKADEKEKEKEKETNKIFDENKEKSHV